MRLAADVTFADGRYRLQRRVGAGGMASVWLALDERLGRRVAVKVVADTLADDPGWLTRFEREARAAAGLSHPNIVQVFDYGIENGRPYLIMEYIPGVNLAERLADPAASAPDTRRLARELLDALAHVHGAQITHRDIKPANILLDAEGRAHVTDFGIAQAEDSTSLTQTGMLVGTIKYLAPEVSAGQPASVLSDLYSAGMVLRELAGQAPPPALATFIATLTASDPAQRPRSAAAALELLDASPPAGSGATAPTEVVDATAATQLAAPAETLLQPAQPGTRDAVQPAVASTGLRRRGVSPAVAGAAALALLAIVILLVSLSGGDAPPQKSSVNAAPAPAQPRAPLNEQLDALKRIIDSAAQRPAQ
ncbi:MAG TPA: serine/threonine-protein kinase [Solirubrobacteraceae bacterium]|nr:serine/threonine-protein kinase [Solirubrobacteraceae bacterium]